MNYKDIKFEVRENVAIITLNRPEHTLSVQAILFKAITEHN